MRQAVLEAIRTTAAIPAMPQAAARFLQLSAVKDCEYDDLVDVLSSDAAISGEVLRLANSAAFGVSRKIGSIKQAMVLLGLARLRCLVLTRYLVQHINKMACGALSLPYYWWRSITCAVISGQICQRIEPGLTEEGFVSGLLADTGVVVLAGAMPENYATIARDYEPLDGDCWVAREQHALGMGHAEVSAMMLERWQLPETIVEAVRHHHDGCMCDPEASRGQQIGSIVGAAESLCQFLCQPAGQSDPATACEEAMKRAGLNTEALCQILPTLEKHIDDYLSLLRLGTARLRKTHDAGRQLLTTLSRAAG